MSTQEIKQIVPCVGMWESVYREKETGREYRYPIACWALIVDHLDEDEQVDFGVSQFEYVRGLTPQVNNQNLIEPLEEIVKNLDFVGYEKNA